MGRTDEWTSISDAEPEPNLAVLVKVAGVTGEHFGFRTPAGRWFVQFTSKRRPVAPFSISHWRKGDDDALAGETP